MTALVSAVRWVVVRRSAQDTLHIVNDIELLEPLERKARSVEVHPGTDVEGGTDADGWYSIVGRLGRLVPWEGHFSYHRHDAGWHSQDLQTRADGWRISGGFLVSPIDATTCRVTHYEDYRLPHRLRWLRVPLTVYMRRSQVGEMRDLIRLVEGAAPVPVEQPAG
ncbi:MAG: hypothetical protein M3Z02_11505 [Actinomycetota bacterium]|nr:hypothetical protein [Actinomycetota bacterium]